MKVFIAGGTGFLGYHATHELRRRGHQVTVMARRTPSFPGYFPPDVQIRLGDLNTISDADLLEFVRGYEWVIYAAGAHASARFQGDAYTYFYNENARSAARFFKLARTGGVKRGVLLGSYFTYFDRMRPDLKLSENHPYIRSRQDQIKESFAAALPDLEVMVLELPWIFGTAPGHIPSWQPLIRYIQSPMPLFFTAGGTNMIAAVEVAQAIAGALEHGKGGELYLVGDENLTWRDLLTRIGTIIGKPKPVITIPTPLVQTLSGLFGVLRSLQGKTSGLDTSKFIHFQTTNTFFDATPARAALGYAQGGLNQALQETVQAALQPR
jgi:nucleoside-diphosphate-sugar epimerase